MQRTNICLLSLGFLLQKTDLIYELFYSLNEFFHLIKLIRRDIKLNSIG